ncbi:hypothetical protein BDB00DRAFT_381892 [Zychaea mexicana]|uniref:uncharacterized protein n=1 Tax=Zychaea mexicana TaxID=64656 RepID=UPI0022FDBD3A|nr:uncharacterized protein BDB00DRAFT_381892 [Zychaea mexicana]KAI9493261.1 hypothetical protein BDB00DRAFT_381892 [Zychaea mexicana]
MSPPSLLREAQGTLDGIRATLSRLRSIEHDVLCLYERFTQTMVVCSGHLVQALVQIEPQQADLHLQQVIKVLLQQELKPQQSTMGQPLPSSRSFSSNNNNDNNNKARVTPTTTTTTERKHVSGSSVPSRVESSELSLQQAIDKYLQLEQHVRQLESEVESLQRFRDENIVCLARMAIQEQERQQAAAAAAAAASTPRRNNKSSSD